MMYTGDMRQFLAGFSSEIEKLATKPLSAYEKDQRKLERDVTFVTGHVSRKNPIDKLRGSSSPRQRDYLASALIAAAAYPAIRIGTSVIGRKIRNKSLQKAMVGASKGQRKRLSKRIETGPMIVGHASGKRGLMTREGLMTDAARGAITGSLLQMVRDRFSGSTPVT